MGARRYGFSLLVFTELDISRVSASYEQEKSALIHIFKKRTRCHSLMALNRASHVPAADWLSQTHVKNYRHFSCVVISFF